MKRSNLGRNLAVVSLIWVMLVMPIAVLGQTKVSLPNNKYKVQDDVKIGDEYSAKVEQEFPLYNDSESERYIEDVGRRLVNSIPSEFQESAFRYRFKIVNTRDINAFALPGGPMYVNRGLIEVAKNEGEMAGVMAHEISHVALRHGTAQATRQSNPLTQLGMLGAIIGGAILGGNAGAQLGAALFAGNFILKYSREYETNADILGAQIMANAGYDPEDLANMFKTIAAESKGGRPPEWLSSHPDPEKRYATISNEARFLRVSENPIKNTQKSRSEEHTLRALPPARSMEEIEKNAPRNPNTGNTGNTENTETGVSTEMSRGTYSANVPLPSSRSRTYQNGNLFQVNIPTNWREFRGQNDVWFSPEGAYGSNGITHGATIGLVQSNQRTLEKATEEYVNGILQANDYLRQTTNYARTTISGRSAYAVRLSGRSPVTGRTEYALIYTTRLNNGNLFYIIGVAPQNDSYRYNRAFNNMVRSIRINSQA
ncbi:MAG: M48 family metalloprotease [Acidobacteria bacterium]|nr:M48 family metalloprotease [Acidobacteriota bacterium]